MLRIQQHSLFYFKYIIDFIKLLVEDKVYMTKIKVLNENNGLKYNIFEIILID